MKSVELDLAGCRPQPLSSYLKGLGVFRLLSSQAGDQIRLSWRGENMLLHSQFTADQVLDWFLMEYAPTPILSPWNGGSGFYPNDKAAAKAIGELENSSSKQFDPYRSALKVCREVLRGLGLVEKPEPKVEKPRLLKALRSALPDQALAWLDAACVVTEEGLDMVPLLGTGGNDGRLDFSSNFIQNLVDLLLGSTKKRERARQLLRQALFGDPTSGLVNTAIGQYAPGQAGGPNTTAGFDGGAVVNPWDFVLTLEGSIVFAAHVTRRLANSRQGASLPFTVSATLGGHSALSSDEAKAARCEMWLPTWMQPMRYREMRMLFSEGRAQVGARQAASGVDFARAVASLGVERGLTSFQRYSFVVRNGKSYFATPTGRYIVDTRRQDQRVQVDLIRELDGWMNRFRRRAEEQGTRLRQCLQRYDEAILTVCKGRDPWALTQVVRCLGQIQAQLGNTPKIQDREGKPENWIPPISGLSKRWRNYCDLGREEVRIALALTSLRGIREYIDPVNSRGEWESKSRDAVWGPGNLWTNLTRVCQRRFLATHLTGSEIQKWRFSGSFFAGPDDVMACLDGCLDENLLGDLIRGLVLVGRADLSGERPAGKSTALPWIYALLKTIYSQLDPRQQLAENWLAPRTAYELVAAGRLDEACQEAKRFLCGRGGTVRQLPTQSFVDPHRLAAALLLPLDERTLRSIHQRTIHREEQ